MRQAYRSLPVFCLARRRRNSGTVAARAFLDEALSNVAHRSAGACGVDTLSSAAIE